MKTCSVCKEVKPVGEFPRNGKVEGVVQRRADCSLCYTIKRKNKSVGKFINNTLHRTGEVATLTLKDWVDALVHFKDCCAYCGVKRPRRAKLTKDHVVPVAQGGLTVRNNIIPACVTCNSSKGGRSLDAWYPRKWFCTAERITTIRRWTHGSK